MTESEIEAAAASDEDAQPTDAAFWTNAKVVMPQPKLRQQGNHKGCPYRN